MLINNNYHHKLFDGLASCLTKLSEFDQAIEVYKQIFQREEGKKKWDAQRSIKFVNKLKRKKAIGALPEIVPGGTSSAGGASSAGGTSTASGAPSASGTVASGGALSDVAGSDDLF